jgi:hypothetical protein
MQDLDFEELDKAVNSLMPNKTVSNNITSPVPASVSPSPSSPRPFVPASSPAVDIKPIDRPSTGRFMDVVHPSSDMRSSLNVPQRSLSPSLAPMPNNSIKEPVVQESPVENVQPVSSAASVNGNWAGLSNYQAPKEVAESPFLPDAKVEKRPLGAFSNDDKSTQSPVEASTVETKDEPKEWAEAPKIEEPKVEAPENSNEAKPDIPAELDSSILSIETSSSTNKNDVDINKNPLSYTPTSTSINQQYKEKPISDKPANGSIYDTSSFNTKSVKPTKKKSSWMVVLWIVVLIVVGVGAGLAFYTYMPDFKLPF